jgi:hypothetical protein
LNWLLLLLLLCRGCKSSRPGDDAAGMNGAGRMVVGLMAASSSSDPRRPGWPAGVVVLHRPLIGERDGMQGQEGRAQLAGSLMPTRLFPMRECELPAAIIMRRWGLPQ